MEDAIGFFDIFWYIIWIFLMVAWFWVMISIVADVFRSQDLNGLAKALWILFIILIPWLGILAYLIIRGDKMHQRNVDTAKAVDEAQREYIRNIAGVSVADELKKLGDLKSEGVITDAEFEAQKARLLSE